MDQEREQGANLNKEQPTSNMEFGESLNEADTDPDLQEAAGEKFGAEESGMGPAMGEAATDNSEDDTGTEFGERIGHVEAPDDFETYDEELRRGSKDY